MGNLVPLMTVVGPILLAVVLLWAMLRNRKRDNPADIARTEAATRDLYKQQDAEDHALDNKVER